MSFTHDELSKMTPFEMPGQPGEPPTGVCVIIPGELPRPIAIYSGIVPEARPLMLAAPMLYQALNRLSAGLGRLNGEIDTFVAQGLIDAKQIEGLRAAFDAMEDDALTSMRCAVEGVANVANGIIRENETKARRK